uniref:Uncharacterized protein n=2 Tax=Phaeomonas parva TaxID=124430 RepID=A0A6U4KRF6_9STRA|mmetsp:Transcript_7036/g.20526  ORF Transcript_7036/g.20526 Transcript_7036/m.20526 type:complete len:488 (+) Transcript_7036:460-1923(+)
MTLHKDGGYSHKEALFGIPRYGNAIMEAAHYSSNDLCSDNEDTHPSPYVMIVERGNCSFVTKVRRAQHMGASAVVVVDNHCTCEHVNVCVPDPTLGDYDDGSCESVVPLMSDDGSAGDIVIPSVIIERQDGLEIKSWIEENPDHNMMVEIQWHLPTPDPRVEWDLWTSPIDFDTATFKEEFQDAVNALGSHAYFKPHYIIYDGDSYGCVAESPTDELFCGDQCSNSGRYCFPDPDGQRDYGLSGADVVRETLRQACIWQLYGSDEAEDEDQHGIGIAWWDYVNYFNFHCQSQSGFNSEDCVRRAMEAADIDHSQVQGCIVASGGYDERSGENSILKSAIEDKVNKGIVIMPSLFVNNIFEKGAMNAPVVFDAICAGYEQGTEPAACECAGIASSSRWETCIENCVEDEDKCGTTPEPENSATVKDDGLGAGAITLIVLSVLFVAAGAGYGYFKYSQDRVRNEVRDILAEYMPLEGEGASFGIDAEVV